MRLLYGGVKHLSSPKTGHREDQAFPHGLEQIGVTWREGGPVDAVAATPRVACAAKTSASGKAQALADRGGDTAEKN